MRRWHQDDWDDFATLRQVIAVTALIALVAMAIGFWIGRSTVSQAGYNEHLLRRAARY